MGGCSFDREADCRVLYINTDVSHRHFNVGACDYFWGNLSVFQYALRGGRCDSATNCGASFLDVSIGPDSGFWDLGACIVILSDVM